MAQWVARRTESPVALRKSEGLHSVSAYGHGPVYIGPCLLYWPQGIIAQELCERRWTSWAVRPNEPSGFRGRKELLNHASALVSACP